MFFVQLSSLVLSLELSVEFYPSSYFKAFMSLFFFFGFPAVLWILKKFNTCFHLRIWYHSCLSCFPFLCKHSILYSVCPHIFSLLVNLPQSLSHVEMFGAPAPGNEKPRRQSVFGQEGPSCRVSVQRLGWFPRALQLSDFSWNGQF